MDTRKKSLSEQIEEQYKEQAEAKRCVEARIGAQNDYLAKMKESDIDMMLEAKRCVEARIGAQNDYLAKMKESNIDKTLEDEEPYNRRKLKGKAVAVAGSVSRPK